MAGVGEETLSGDIPETVFSMFQLTFAIITPALIVGGFAERMRFSAMLIFSAVWVTLVYFPITHWVWVLCTAIWIDDLSAFRHVGPIDRQSIRHVHVCQR